MLLLSLASSLLAALPLVSAIGIKGDNIRESKLAVTAKTTFTHSELGIKLVNGQATKANITFTNSENTPITAHLIGGSLTKPISQDIIRNLTARPFDLTLGPGEQGSLEYTFVNEITPQDVYVNLHGIVMSDSGSLSRITLFNGTAAIVEAPLDIFDPQMLFLYLFLIAVAGGISYKASQIWIAPLFPVKRVIVPAKVLVPVATHPGGYDPSWIQDQHRPEGKATRRKAKK